MALLQMILVQLAYTNVIMATLTLAMYYYIKNFRLKKLIFFQKRVGYNLNNQLEEIYGCFGGKTCETNAGGDIYCCYSDNCNGVDSIRLNKLILIFTAFISLRYLAF